jgi:hypothetical protein
LSPFCVSGKYSYNPKSLTSLEEKKKTVNDYVYINEKQIKKKKNFLSQGLSEIHAKENQTVTKNGQSNREAGNMGYKTQNGDKQIENYY